MPSILKYENEQDLLRIGFVKLVISGLFSKVIDVIPR